MEVRRRKTNIKLIILVLCLMLLCGCTRSFKIKNPAKVTIQRAEDYIEITDADTVSKLTTQITSMTFKRGESSKKMTGWDYRLIWYNKAGHPIFDACIFPQCIDYNGRFWICEDKTINTAYYDELLDG